MDSDADKPMVTGEESNAGSDGDVPMDGNDGSVLPSAVPQSTASGADSMEVSGPQAQTEQGVPEQGVPEQGVPEQEAEIKIPPRTKNMFNKMLLLSSNVLPEEPDLFPTGFPDTFCPLLIMQTWEQNKLTADDFLNAESLTTKAKSYSQNMLVDKDHLNMFIKCYQEGFDDFKKLATDFESCSKYDLRSLNEFRDFQDNEARKLAIAEKFYRYSVEVQLYSSMCVAEIEFLNQDKSLFINNLDVIAHYLQNDKYQFRCALSVNQDSLNAALKYIFSLINQPPIPQPPFQNIAELIEVLDRVKELSIDNSIKKKKKKNSIEIIFLNIIFNLYPK